MKTPKLDRPIIILPSLNERKNRFSSISNQLFYSYRSHCSVFEKCGGDTNIVSEPNYKFESLDVIVEQYEREGNVIPETSIIHLSDFQNVHSSDVNNVYQAFKKNLDQLQRVHASSPFELSYYQCQSVNDHVASLNQKLKDVSRHQYSEIPIFEYSNKEISLHNEHIEQMTKNPKWIIQLVIFFSSLTKNKMTVTFEDLNFDSFVYNQNGTIAAFISYDLVNIRPNLSSTQMTETNLRAFSKLIWAFYDYSSNVDTDSSLFTNHNSLLYKLLQRIKSETEIEFTSFQEIASFLKGEEVNVKPARFGVFLDVANIYTGLQTMEIDYHSLFLSVFGLEAKGRIKEENKHAVIFLPVYEDERKTNKVQRHQRELKETLELEFSFKVHETTNATPRAKSFINGEEIDVDDKMLIRKMEERLDYLDHILLLSGDAHFVDVLKKYKQEGKKVSVISIHEDDTSDKMQTEFDHKFIHEYAESISI
ncbi:NYN domain-containing protein [Alkalihalobacillus deserti]|uniref:NYN domain-containing protein n=1 Tax=Alkalihalobacillus deserti TaxID=2879466 RepID=UPI001D15167C|nr:NYN domain-containing protein [Alkalihalobacillus deserti]